MNMEPNTPVKQIVVGQASPTAPNSPAAKTSLARKLITKRTVYTFVLLMIVLGGYIFFVTEKVQGYASAVLVPSYCPQNIWNQISNSSWIFGKVYLNPTLNDTQLAVMAAQICKAVILNQTSPLALNDTATVPNTGLVVYNQTPMGGAGGQTGNLTLP